MRAAPHFQRPPPLETLECPQLWLAGFHRQPFSVWRDSCRTPDMQEPWPVTLSIMNTPFPYLVPTHSALDTGAPGPDQVAAPAAEGGVNGEEGF